MLESLGWALAAVFGLGSLSVTAGELQVPSQAQTAWAQAKERKADAFLELQQQKGGDQFAWAQAKERKADAFLESQQQKGGDQFAWAQAKERKADA